MVPEPEFESYYGRQIIKTPTWKTPDVPLYLFLGGMAGASAVLAEGAALTGNVALERVTRLVAASGAGVGTVFLVHDLGRPERFLHMLRVIKPTSPLSVGSFILAPFSALSSAAAASCVTGRLPRLGRLAGLGAAAFGPPLATYTARPARQHRRTRLARGPPRAAVPFRGLGCQRRRRYGAAADPRAAQRPGPPDGDRGSGDRARRVGAAEASARHGRRALRAGTPGSVDAARVADDAGRGRRLHARRPLACGVGALRGGVGRQSVVTRFGVFEAGLASARDPKYTVVPQRERMAARART